MTLNCYGTTPTPDTEAFRIEATVTDAGELPTSAIFVFSMTKPEIEDADTFARIANPQDLQNLSRDRDAAVASDLSEYLASYASFQYANLDQAVEAKATLRSRVNELVNSWITYQTTFLFDSGTSTSFPTSDPTVEDSLITAYKNARTARIEAEAAFTAADMSVTMLDAELEQSRTYLPQLEQASEAMSAINQKLYSYWDDVVSEGADAIGKRTALVSYISEEGAYFSSALQTQRNLIVGQESALTGAKTEKTEAAATLSAAQEAEDAALAAVLAVTPDFDPASV